MKLFDPPVIIAANQTNTFTTLSQPFPVNHQTMVGIWETESWRNEQGLSLDVPIYYKNTSGNYELTSLQNYPINSVDPFAKKNVICHWVTQPYQTVGGSGGVDPEYLDVGVIAFHGTGLIDRVEFFLNGTTQRLVVNDVSHHPDHDVTAYWIRINKDSGLTDSGDIWPTSISSIPSNFGKVNGVTFSPHHELQAVVYPKHGKPRILAGKHENRNDTNFDYNAIPEHRKDLSGKVTVQKNDSNIRSLYFSSNFNNTLFNESVYLSMDTGVDDLNRSGNRDEPLKTMEFGFKKLMRKKYRFYNGGAEPANLISDGEVGGGVLYLMELISEKNRVNGHKFGFKTLTQSQADSNNDPFKSQARMRWITITKDPEVTNKALAKIKGFYLQQFPQTIPATTSLISKTLQRFSQKGNITASLTRYKDVLIEGDWPYTEYLYGIGPNLDVIGDNGSGEKLGNSVNDWFVKGGVLTGHLSNLSEDTQEPTLFTMRDDNRTSHDYSMTQSKSQAGPFVPPRFWFDSTEVNGNFRTRNGVIEWARSLGMTYTVSFVPPPDFAKYQTSHAVGTTGLFYADTLQPVPFSSLEIKNPDGSPQLGFTLETPRIFVRATDETLALTEGLGFTTGIGYTFDFCWTNAEFSGTNATFSTRTLINTAFTNSSITSVVEPSQLSIYAFINSNINRYDRDVFRYSSSLIYQPFLYDAFASKNYVNVDDAPLFAGHSDVFQTIGGELNVKKEHVGYENFIFYRFNNPSPRSKRYSDPVARLGKSGVGPLDDILFLSQWNISGRSDGTIPQFFYNPAKWPEGDGRTYSIYTNRHVKDLIFQDCLIYTEDGSQQLQMTCLHENTIFRNTFFNTSQSFNNTTSGSSPATNQTLFSSAQAKFGGNVIRYRDAVKNNTLLHTNNNDLKETEVTAYDHVLVDNVQAYKGSFGTSRVKGTYHDSLFFNIKKKNGETQKVTIKGPTRPKPFGHPDYGNPINRPASFINISNMRYPFQKDANGNARPGQLPKVGASGPNTPNIFFPVLNNRYTNAALTYLSLPGVDPTTAQPNSSTRGEWFTYHKSINAGTTRSDAPYGWVHSSIPYENFRYGRLPHPAGTTFIANNAAIQNVDPTFLIKLNKDDGNGGLTWGTTINDTRAALGTGWDPTYGTGVYGLPFGQLQGLSGFCANQRGFRETVVYSYTNFDYDATRSEFGEVLLPSELSPLGGDGGDISQSSSNSLNALENTSLRGNHPITVRLTTTDIKKDMTWSYKDDLGTRTPHGADSFYPSNDIVQIPNYLERIKIITDPSSELENYITDSKSNEITGNSADIVQNQGGVYVTGGSLDIILNSNIETQNSIDVKPLATKFQSIVRTAGGNTFALILHGKSDVLIDDLSGVTFGEYKYLAAPDFDPKADPDQPGTNIPGLLFDYHKLFAHIAFHSKEAPVTQSITSNQFSFRKSPHHTFLNFSRPEMDGLSLSSELNGTSIIDMVTPIDSSKLTKIQTSAIGCTCSFNSYGIESTTANKVSGTSTATTITCKNKNLEYLGFDGNQIRFKNKTTTSMFSNTAVRYEHNGAIGSNIPDFQFFNSVNDYRFEVPLQTPDTPAVPEQSINLRFLNPIGSGAKNLFAYKVPLNGVRLFGGASNIGITAGSYIRISDSPNNNGIYQVLSTIDGIDGDSLSNTASGGSTEYQYLELSRSITPQEQAVVNNIKIENVSHLPILHVKYRERL